MLVIISFLLIGAITGLLSGLLGIGGGVISVPLLVLVFENSNFPADLIMQFAVGTSLAVMVVTTSAALRAHLKKGRTVWPILKFLVPGLITGVVCGGLLADYLQSNVLQMMFAFLMIIIAFKSFFGGSMEFSQRPLTPQLLVIGGFFAGGLSGLFGIGGGIIIIPFLLFLSVDIRKALAVSTGCGLVSGIVGTITYILTGLNEVYTLSWATGHIYWPAFLGLSLTTPIFATLGANLGYHLPIRMLTRIFALFLLLAALKLLIY